MLTPKPTTEPHPTAQVSSSAGAAHIERASEPLASTKVAEAPQPLAEEPQTPVTSTPAPKTAHKRLPNNSSLICPTGTLPTHPKKLNPLLTSLLSGFDINTATSEEQVKKLEEIDRVGEKVYKRDAYKKLGYMQYMLGVEAERERELEVSKVRSLGKCVDVLTLVVAGLKKGIADSAFWVGEGEGEGVLV